MADKNPFGGLGLGQLGSERQYMGRSGLGAVAGLWLADKAGLIDLSQMDENQKNQMQSQGVLQSILKNKMSSSAPPVGAVAPKIGDTSVGANYDIAPVKPPKLNAQGDMGANQKVSYDHDVIDHSLSNYANMFVPAQQDQFKARDTSQDQIPQFAQNGVAPPIAQFMQPPQSNGGLMKLLAAFA